MSRTHLVAASKGRMDWETPPWLFESLHREFRFDVDAAADQSNAKLPRYWSVRQDGLAQPWRGLRVFCNPPYGREKVRWVEKAASETGAGGCPLALLILPAGTEKLWWHQWVMAHAHEVRFICRRIHFLLKGRKVGHSRPRFNSAVAVFREGQRRGPLLATSLIAPDPRLLCHGRVVAQEVLFT